MDTPTLRQLRTFVAAVERGSVTEAARSLHLTQPAASQQLRELERILGTRLLDRAGGRVVATAAGHAILAAAKRAQSAAEEAVSTAAAFRLGETGRVRIGTGAVRRQMVWDSRSSELMEELAHLGCDVRRLGYGAASGVAGWSAA